MAGCRPGCCGTACWSSSSAFTLLATATTSPRCCLPSTASAIPTHAINGHGPLTTEPTDPAIANHLDAAERLLTEVNHTSGSLDPATRAQAHDLLLSNAVYVRTARDHGDLAQAAVLDDLGRVLTTLDNEPPRRTAPCSFAWR